MLALLWHNWLYVPLLNFLVILYNGPAFGSVGIAVVCLTFFTRFGKLA